MPTRLTNPITPPAWTTQRIAGWCPLMQRNPETGLFEGSLCSMQIEVETLDALGNSVGQQTYSIEWSALPQIVRDGMKDMHEYLIQRCHINGWIGQGTDEAEW